MDFVRSLRHLFSPHRPSLTFSSHRDDRLSWTYSGNVFSDSSIPSATDPYRNNTGALWAPDVTYLGDSGNGGEGTYVLYYAASTGGSERSAVFVATSETGYAGTWKDGGLVVETSTGSGYNAIDPQYVQRLSPFFLPLPSSY